MLGNSFTYSFIVHQICNQYSVDTDKEEVILMTSGGCTTEELADKVPEESARYHLFRFKHTHQGDYRESGGQ